MNFSELLKRRREDLQTPGNPIQKLFNKAHSLRLVQSLGVTVPEVFHDGPVSGVDLDRLPACFVIKPVTGHSGKGVACVMNGVDLMTGQAFVLDRYIERVGQDRRCVVEEFIANRWGSYEDVESFKVFYFGKRRVIRYVRERFDPGSGSIRPLEQSFYDESWRYIEQPISSYVRVGPPIEKPEHFEQLMAFSSVLGGYVGDFIRLDFFISPKGVVFNEFCPFPFNGKHFTDFGDEYLGRLWIGAFRIDVREAGADDVEVLTGLLSNYYVETYAEILGDDFVSRISPANLRKRIETEFLGCDDCRIFVAINRLDGGIVGLLAVGPLRWRSKVPDDYQFELQWLYILEAFRGLGVSDLLENAVASFLNRIGHNKAVAFCLQKNTPIVERYTRRGTPLLGVKDGGPYWRHESIMIFGVDLVNQVAK